MTAPELTRCAKSLFTVLVSHPICWARVSMPGQHTPSLSAYDQRSEYNPLAAGLMVGLRIVRLKYSHFLGLLIFWSSSFILKLDQLAFRIIFRLLPPPAGFYFVTKFFSTQRRKPSRLMRQVLPIRMAGKPGVWHKPRTVRYGRSRTFAASSSFSIIGKLSQFVIRTPPGNKKGRGF